MNDNSWIDRTKTLMENQGITPINLAAMLGVSVSLIYFYLKGTRTPPLSKVYEIAEILQVSPSYLLFGLETGASEAHKLSVIDYQSINSRECKILDKPDWPILLKKPYTAYRVYDDSASPQDAATLGFYIDSVVIVDPSRACKDNNLILAQLDSGTTPLIRYYTERFGSRYLKPINYRFSTINLADHPNFKCLGVIIGNYRPEI